MTTYRKKLIEVALPLDAINAESAREKSIRHGHPSTLHLWWARRPLAACRAVLFASLVDDPAEPAAPPVYLAALDELPKPASLPLTWDTMTLAEQRRERLFSFIAKLVKWENSTNEYILTTARNLINLACEGNPPPVLDPFCGGGSIPLEAQRLGLEAHASDLNPVAVLITKALIEIPPKFAGRPPVNPEDRRKIGAGTVWKGAAGLAADVRYYGKWMRDEAERRIGYLYPRAKLSDGTEATVIAWLWARTVKCPNPECGAQMPLVRSFALSTKPGKQAWVEPVVDRSVSPRKVHFQVKTGTGKPPEPPKLGRGAKFRCLACSNPVDDERIKAEAKAGRMEQQLMAVVAEGQRGRIYLSPTPEQEAMAGSAPEADGPTQELANDPRNIWCVNYGLDTFDKLFTRRQLVALTTFSDLVGEARERVRRDAVEAGMPDDGVPLAEGGTGAQAYADAVATYLGLGVSKLADASSSLVRWKPSMDQAIGTFGRQALPMVWDFAESNMFNRAAGDYGTTVANMARVLDAIIVGDSSEVTQRDAAVSERWGSSCVATDPPYYDNVGYADLADFSYVWLRRSLREVLPDLFTTMLVPKTPELVATPYRFGGDKRKAEQFFEDGLSKAFVNIRAAQHPACPFTIYYAFKQSEFDQHGEDGSNISRSLPLGEVSTGWETMLNGLIAAGFVITGTWPMRSELGNRMIASGTNALASSIVLVCRPRPEDVPISDRKEFLQELALAMRDELPILAEGGVAPVDLAQASIGPGMAVYSKYRQVVRQDGRPVTVREALADINNAIASYRAERVSAFDGETRFCIDWYTQHGWADGPYGDADTLSRAYDVAPNAMERDGLLDAERGRVRLLPPASYPVGVGGLADRAFQGSAWEACLRLAQTLAKEGEAGTAALVRELGEGVSARARELAVWLYTIADGKKRAEDAFLFNALDASWAGIQEHVAQQGKAGQERLTGL